MDRDAERECKVVFRAALDFLIRRLGLLPGGTPDRIGQDRALRATALPHEVMVYFADTVGSLYQIEQWYEPFRALNEKHRLVVVMADSRTAKRVRAQSGLDVIVVGKQSTMEALVAKSNIRVTLYVNHNPENFAHLKIGSMVHASLMHGDSDKGVTVSNQTKAYDFSLVAGQAAVDRMAAFSTFYDAAARCIPIGRPQVDSLSTLDTRPGSTAPRVALYAPTWEGPQPSAAYGSIESHGLRVVESLIADGWQVIYRPHPLSGIRSQQYRDADQRIRSVLVDAESRSPRGHHTDANPSARHSFESASVMVCDISGVAMDWLPTGKPLIITHPVGSGVSVAQSPLTALVPRLYERAVESTATLAREQVYQDPLFEERSKLVHYYLGDQRPGSSLASFVGAVERMMTLRDDPGNAQVCQ